MLDLGEPVEHAAQELRASLGHNGEAASITLAEMHYSGTTSGQRCVLLSSLAAPATGVPPRPAAIGDGKQRAAAALTIIHTP
jgi:hypothetical protein